MASKTAPPEVGAVKSQNSGEPRGGGHSTSKAHKPRDTPTPRGVAQGRSAKPTKGGVASKTTPTGRGVAKKSTVTAGTVASTESATVGVHSEELVVSVGITGRNKPEADPGSIPTRGMPRMPEEEAEGGVVSKTTPPGEEGAILTPPDCEDLEFGCPVRVPDGSEKQELNRKQK